MAKLDKFIIDGTTYEIVPEIAPLFNESDSYSVGNCVIKDAALYRFTANHTGAWTGNDVEAIEVADRLNKISDSVAPEFSASASYTAGSYVYKNGVLHRFTSDHSGAWTGTDAEVVTVGGEVADLKADLDNLNDYVTSQDFSFVSRYGFSKQLWKISNGNLVSDSYKSGYRVATPYTEPIYISQGTKFVLPDDRRLYYAYSVDKTSGSWVGKGWITGEKTFDGGYYALLISSLADTVAVTDVSTFLNGVKVYNQSDGETIVDQINLLQDIVTPYTGKILGMEAGGYSFNKTTGWTKSSYGATNRIRLKNSINLEKGTRIIPPDGFVLWVGFKFNDNYYYETKFTYADYICDLTATYVFMIKTYDDSAYTDSVSDISNNILIIPPNKVPNSNEINYVVNLSNKSVFNKIKSVARIGYNIGSPASPPQNSIEGFKLAYDYGYRVMLADVRWTSDGVPVALHDVNINSVARNLDGTEISTTINIDSISLAEADGYDFGIIRGPRYAGTKIMRIDDFLEWCALHDCKPFLEIKSDGVSSISDKLVSLFAVIDKYNLGNFCMYCCDNNTVSTSVHAKYPNATIAISFSDGTPIASTFAYAATLKDNNEVFIYVYSKLDFSYQITSEMVSAAVKNGINLGITEVGVSGYRELNQFLQNKYNLAVDWVAIQGMPLSHYIAKGFAV